MPHKDPKKKADYNRRYYQENKQRLQASARQYYADNIDQQRVVRKRWREGNRDRIKANNEVYRKANQARIRDYQRQRELTPEGTAKRREQKRRYYQQRIQRDPQWKLQRALRMRFWLMIRKRQFVKSESSLELVGCDLETLVSHLERQFQPGMSWENYGVKGWHIDHIIPCAAFDLSDPEARRRCFHFTNLQPLWAKQNRSKGARILPPVDKTDQE